MQTKTLTHGFSLPVIGFGTWKLAGGHTRDDSIDTTASKDAIRYAIKKGMTHLDTAELYGMWQTEEMLGEILHEFDRDSLCITSKVIGKLASYDAIHAAIDKSLARMKLDYLDVYLIHWRDELFSIEEQMRAMNELYDAGKIRNIGVSNFSKESLQKAQELSRAPIVLNQVHYNLIYRAVDTTGLLEYCRKHDVLVQAWRPIQYGDLSDATNPIMERMCQKYQATPAQITIAWLIAQEQVVTLFMSKSPKHIDENLAVLDWKMSPEDVELLRAEYPNQTNETHVPLS